MTGADDAIQRAARELAPRVLGAVVRRCGDFATAEDVVQEALLAAIAQWRERGVPSNPGGWLYQVACRRLLDQREAALARTQREASALASRPEVAPPPAVQDDDGLAVDGDDTLRLLFLCCHPALTRESAIALTLRAVGGLTTAQIARAFLVPEATMAQRISRAKQTIADAGATFALADGGDRTRRLGAVLHVVYLLGNEGHVASDGDELTRVDLAQEAIRLARLVRAGAPEHAEASGLLALLLLTEARRAARTDAAGDLVPLPEQDRTHWDRAAIAEGTNLMNEVLRAGTPGSYTLQAAIAAVHGAAATFAATDWRTILALYDRLAALGDHPVVALNRAVAVAMVHGPAAGLAAVAALADDARLRGSFRVDAVRGHLHEMAGGRDLAAASFTRAAAAADNAAERRYLQKKLAALRNPAC